MHSLWSGGRAELTRSDAAFNLLPQPAIFELRCQEAALATSEAPTSVAAKTFSLTRGARAAEVSAQQRLSERLAASLRWFSSTCEDLSCKPGRSGSEIAPGRICWARSAEGAV